MVLRKEERRRSVQMPSVELSVLIVSWNTRDLLRECLRSLLSTLGSASAEVIVVDNASSDGSAAMVRDEFLADPRVRLIENACNEKFARGNNRAYAAAAGEFVAVINTDVRFTEPVLARMVGHLRAHPEVGVVSCGLVGVDGVSQSAHRSFPTLPTVFFVWNPIGRRVDRWFLMGLNGRRYRLISRPRTGVQVVDQAAAACMVITRCAVERIGGLFDERFPLFFNDVDLCRRVWKAGMEVHVLYDLSVIHVGGASTRQLGSGMKNLELLDGLLEYYRVHEPPWKWRLARLMVAGKRRRAVRASAAAKPFLRTPGPR
jgi:GT2 family glycosyltransferase